MSTPSQLGRAALLAMLLVSILITSSLLAADTAPPPRQLSEPSVTGMMFSPDSRRVVFVRYPDLYSIAPVGGAAVKLNGLLAQQDSDRAVTIQPFNVQISRDSSRVVYIARQQGDATDQLYSVPILGGTPVKLNSPLASGLFVTQFLLSPDGSRVVYITSDSFGSSSHHDVYSVPIAGGTAVKLNQTLAADESVMDVQISADSSRVVYDLFKGAVDGQWSLFSVSIAGGSRATLVAAQDRPLSDNRFSITPDSSRVVYRQRPPLSEDQLWSQPIGGGTAAQLALPAGSKINQYFAITPDSRRVVFLASSADGASELYSTLASGGDTSVNLSAPLPDDAGVSAFKLSHDGSRLVYLLAQGSSMAVDLYSVPPSGGAATRLTSEPRLIESASIQISPDNSRVVYLDQGGTDAVYSVPLTGGAPVKLGQPLPASDGIWPYDLSITPDSRAVLYRARNIMTSNFELFLAPIDGSPTAQKLSGSVPLVAGGPYQGDLDAIRPRTSPNSRFIVFGGGTEELRPRTLYIVDLGPRFSSFLPVTSR